MSQRAPRQAWNDQRTDEFVQRTEESFREIRAEIRNLRGKIDRRSDITLGAMLTGFVGLIVTHFIG
jgi:hypothetical protein